MTIDPPSAHTKVGDEFILDLRRFINACCLPSDRELVRLTRKVIADRRREIPALQDVTQAVFSRVMTGKRQGPPAWGWVATVVLTCLDFHAGSGAKLDFDGPVTLQGWYTRYQEMRDQLARVPVSQPVAVPAPKTADAEAKQDHRQTDVSGASAPGAESTDARESPPLDGPVSTPPSPPPGPPDPHPTLPARELRLADLHDNAIESWLPVLGRLQSMAHRRYYGLLGQHGTDLLSAAEDGDREATSRLGILLLCHDLPSEGMAWLRSAARHGDEPAEILISAAPSQRRQLAAEFAYEFTLPGYAQDRADGSSPTGAEIYYRAAAAAGHMGATVRMGLIYEARGEITTALHTYAQAAAQAHPEGIGHFARLNNQLVGDWSNRRHHEPPPP
ncbi:hypothetical protein [Actinomadura sp. 3N407]|uniref:hypothetical protein n=1 Tax=Actinomadura sp. 3N407 TaxID=3457423 RepID=UPI003FCC8E95